MDGFIGKKTLMTTRKIIIENGIYHVTQRAPGKEVVFVEDADYLKFISLLKETSQKFKIEVFCFALLPNHLHILVRIKDVNLSEAMKYLFKRYAQWFNAKYQRKGHVFCGVYRAAFCDNDEYLIAASLYIHLNPLKAYLTKDIFKYRWSSLNCYVKQFKGDPFVNYKMILEMLGDNGYSIYKNLISSTVDLKYASIIEDKNAVKVFRINFSCFFKDWLRKNKIENYIIDEVLNKETNIDGLINRNKRKNKFTDKKGFLYSVEQLRARGYTFEEISKKMGVGRASIYRLIKDNKKLSKR